MYKVRGTTKNMETRAYITNGVTTLHGFKTQKEAKKFVKEYLKK